MTTTPWKRVASGDYETPDGRYRMWRIPGVYPAAWNVEDVETCEVVVDGAASMRDARAIFSAQSRRSPNRDTVSPTDNE